MASKDAVIHCHCGICENQRTEKTFWDIMIGIQNSLQNQLYYQAARIEELERGIIELERRLE